MAELRRNSIGRRASLLALGCVAFTLLATSAYAAQNYGDGAYGAGDYNVGETLASSGAASSASTPTQPGGRRGSSKEMAKRIASAGDRIRGQFAARMQQNDRSQSSSTARDGQNASQPGDVATEEPKDTTSLASIAARRGRLLAHLDGQEVLYRDVPVDAWYAPYVATVITEGIAEGYRDESGKPTGEFGVANSVTRAEVLKMSLEAAGTELPGGAPRNVSAKGTWAGAYVAAAESLQMTGFTPDVDVTQPATRGEVVQAVLEAMDFPIATQTSTFTDVAPTHPQSKSIATAAFFGLVEGDRDTSGALLNTFRPNDPISRAEVSKIIALIHEVAK